MDIIVFTFNAVVPLFILIGVGYVMRSVGLMSEDVAIRVNKICFSVMLPCNFFYTIYKADLAVDSFGIVGFAFICYCVLIPIWCFIIPKVIKNRPQAGAVIQATYRSNTVLLGLPIMTNIFGAENGVPMALLITFIIPCHTVVSVIVLTLFSDENGGKKISVREIAEKIFKNPITIAAIVGIAVNLIGIELPALVEKPIYDLSLIASPLAMMALGARFNLKSLNQNRLAVAVASVCKLLIMPAIITGSAAVLGYRGPELGALLISTGCPQAVAAVAMADAMGCDGKLSGEIMVTTSLLSCFTLFAWLCVLQFAGLM